MVDPGSGRDQRRLPDPVSTLAEHMKERGYFTLGATANPNLSTDFGFNQGFDVYQPGLKDGWGHQSGVELVDALLAALKQDRATGDARPVYLRVMLIDAHSPRSAMGDKLDPYREPDVPERVAQYRYHLHQLDGALAHLAEGLEAQGLTEENTVFVFVADHGEGMNYPRHHGYSHGQYHMTSTNQVPWILRGAGVARGHRVLGLASQVDVVPTLLGLIGRPLADASAVEGRDWSALVRGEGFATTWDRVISDTWFQESSRAAIWTRDRQCQDDFGSAARQAAKGLFVPGCFDRRADPLFRTPLTDPPLQAELRAWREAKTAKLPEVQAPEVEIDEALGKELEALGYRE
jgi:arylsulfatase A-like enzyme